MKRKCRNVDITDIALITRAVLACLKPAKKRRRYDTVELFASILGTGRKRATASLAAMDSEYIRAVGVIAERMCAALVNGVPDIRKPAVAERVDSCSMKKRKVAVLNIRNLLYDHVAVLGLEEACRAIGEYQVSSISGRGAAYGDRAIRKWLRQAAGKKMYSVKLDIKNFYGSVDQDILMSWLKERVANKKLLWLVGKLVSSVDKGMAIGSFLSQTLANLYLSPLYHKATEGIYSMRRGKRINVFRHALFYMDDMLLLGHNKRAMENGVCTLTVFASERLGLEVKPHWRVREVCSRYPIDIMGYRYDGTKTYLRRRIYKYARRMMVRAERTGIVPLRASCRLVSYKGYMDRTASLPKGLDCARIFKKARKAASIYHARKSSLHKQA